MPLLIRITTRIRTPAPALCAILSVLLCLACPDGVDLDDGPDAGTLVSDGSGGPRPVVVEIDQMAGTETLQLEQTINGETVALDEIYGEANLALDLRFDELDLPRTETVRIADLHALMTENSTVDAGDALKVYVLVVTEDFERPDTLGIMFDFGQLDVNDIPREAFAVFQSPHERLSTPLAPEMLLTSAHELAHVFNLHHPDWTGQEFASNSTIEGYSLTDTVVWSLSDQSKAHLTGHERRLVDPGTGSLPFGMVTEGHLDAHQAVPQEDFDVVDGRGVSRVRRDSGVAADSAVRSRLARRGARAEPRETGSLRLVLSAPKMRYDVGEPIVLTVQLINAGDSPREVLNLLEPEYRFLSLSISGRGDEEARRFRPALIYEARGRPTTMLEPGQSIFAEAKVFFGAGGWTFREAGEYEITAAYPAEPTIGEGLLVSEPATLRILDPRTEDGRRALRALRATPEEPALGTEQGLSLLFGGGDHLIDGADAMREISRSAPSSPHAASATLALATAALNPTIRTGVRGPGAVPEPRVEEAERLLRDLSSESLCPLSLLRAQEDLARALERKGQESEAERLRDRAAEKLRSSEQFRKVPPKEVPKIIGRQPVGE